MASVSEARQPIYGGDDVATQIVSIEVALDVCNNISGIITEQLDAVEARAVPDPAEIKRLMSLQWQFLRDERNKLTRDHMDHVRDFIEIYAPQVKAYFQSRTVPKFITG